jgi:hypothetical protein
MDSLKRDNVRLSAVLIGDSAVVAFGALSVAQQQVPSTIEATTMAAPAMRGPAALPAEEQGPAAP